MSSDPARVLLIGQGPTAASALDALLEHFRVVGLVRSGDPDDPVAQAAATRQVPVHSTPSIDAIRTFVDRTDPDAVVVSSYDRILPADLVSARPFVNVHYAPLPRYRGRATVNWAIINGEPEVSISIHCLVPGLDAGGILARESMAVGPRDTVTDLYEGLNSLQRKLLGPAVARRISGDEGTPQEEGAATYTCTRIPADGEVDWSASTDAIDRLIRALTEPYPGAYTWLGLKRLTVLEACPVPDAPIYEGRVPGRVVRVNRSAGWVDVLTGDGVLRLNKLALDGSEPGAASAVVTSLRQTLGLQTSDMARELVLLREQLEAIGAKGP
jgi:methionyl-tRNA formyltransferase